MIETDYKKIDNVGNIDIDKTNKNSSGTCILVFTFV